MLKILFSTSSERIEELKQDFEDVKNDYGLPCEITPDYVSVSNFRTNLGVAVTYYEDVQIQQGFPEIEIPPQYFDLSERKLTLLHEMIHACQRSSSLESLNKEYLINLIHKLEQIQKDTSDEDNYVFSIDAKIQMVYMHSTWIFEIWDEMCLKIEYPDLYVKKLDQTYDLISSALNTEMGGYGNWKKYIFLFQFVRAKYLQKITHETHIESKFESLCNEWEQRLKSFVDEKEFNRLMSKVDGLTDVDAYNSDDSTSLKKLYEEMIQEMLGYLKK